MRVNELTGLLWSSHRKVLSLLLLFLITNVLLFVILDQFVIPEVLARESRFLQRQTEVRNLLRSKGPAALAPERHFVLASQDLSRFHQSVPEYEMFTGLIEELLVLSNRSRLNLTRINYNAEELESSPMLKFNLSFNVAGDYAQIKKFIHSLEQSTRLLIIKQIGLQNEAENGVNLRLNLETYFLPGEQPS